MRELKKTQKTVTSGSILTFESLQDGNVNVVVNLFLHRIYLLATYENTSLEYFAHVIDSLVDPFITLGGKSC